MDTETVFEVREASYAYNGKQPALIGVNLRIHRGERIAILGANGCGKSTLLKLLDGLCFPTSGTIYALGMELTESHFQDEEFNFRFRRQVGLVFQDSDVQLFSPSVWDEVAFAPLQLGLTREEVIERVEAALSTLQIESLRERAPHRLSGGEKKRVALASVLSLNPDVWIMDEPTAGLDPRSQSWLEEFIGSQGSNGKTIITATHDLSLVEAIADRVVVLNEAHRVEAVGTPAEILSDTRLLIACNLLHQHWHRHAASGVEHSHPHVHGLLDDHDHEHDDSDC